jgi:TonB family protein
MIKYFLALVLSILFLNIAFAQKRDTSVYYLKNSGKAVSSKDSADFFLVILQPDVSVDKNLFIVKEYYKNGKVRLIGNSRNDDLNLKFQGSQITFFPNGRKMRISNFEDGEPVGDVIEYYPNGKLYNIKSYLPDKSVLLTQCNDSTENVLVEHGTGKWREYNENFTAIDAEGDVVNGLASGQWNGRMNDSVNFEKLFIKGALIYTSKIYKYKQGSYNDSPDSLKIFTVVEKMPEFPGGIDGFAKFLGYYIRYPGDARRNGTHGRVVLNFVVERDGSLTNLKVYRGIGDGCDEEALRVMKLSPHWSPGMQNGIPVRVAFSIPIAFAITGR